MDKRKNVLIDPSLLVAKNSINNTFDYIREPRMLDRNYQFYLPMSFLRLLSKPSLETDSPEIRFFLHNAKLVDPNELYGLIKQYSKIILPFEIDYKLIDKHSWMYKGLREELDLRGELLDEDLLKILFEEWVFMQEWSWVVSRIKKPFNRLGAAGAGFVQLSRRALDELVRKTPRIRKQDELITNVQRLRALGKWIAVVVGSPMLASIHPWLSGLPNLVWLLDPEAEGGTPNSLIHLHS